MAINMAERGGLVISTNLDSPNSLKKDSRKVPGGFNADDEDDLSPTKSRIDLHDNDWVDNRRAHAHNSNAIPSLDMETLPALPPGNSSLLHAYSDVDAHSDQHMDTLDEQAMRRHLGDMESSFLPPAPSPLTTAQNHGADDTFLFDGARSTETKSQRSGTMMSEESDGVKSPTTDPHSYQTPHATRAHTPDPEDTSNVPADTTSSLETMSSSPTTAAAARTISRAVSQASLGYQTANEQDTDEQTDEDNRQEETPRYKKRGLLTASDSDDERSTIRNQNSSNSLMGRSAKDAGSTPGAGLLGRKTSGRPKYLRSRNTSQRSSVSSFLTNDSYDDQSDVQYGADYALQSGGAVPADGRSRAASYQMSRSISLGSMASGFDDNASTVGDKPFEPPLATLDEEERNRSRPSTAVKNSDGGEPETPRPNKSQAMAAPTDTVIARHVQNVLVPDSVAREYRDKNRSPSKGSDFSTLGRGKNLTLKEQSSTIERLSKENFDLKLKVMFLSDRLDKLSEEGVKETISENVELKTALANLQRDNKALRRKNKDLEQRAKEEEGRPSTAKSGTSSEERRQDSDEGTQEREEELIYLREQVEEYITEIERLRRDALSREHEKRKMAETVKAMGDSRGDGFEAREEMDVWRDLLEQETARREQVEDDNRRLREDLFRLKSDVGLSSATPGLNHTTNIYNITKKRQLSPSRPRSEMSERVDDRNGTFSAASTLVEDLRRESEQLRHENAELRREVGAQTSMLTSRNREKERLYQEIEDLKLGQRRGGGSIAGDSILERSASRAHERSLSRNSGRSKLPGLDEAEREEYEMQTAELRDKISDLRLKNVELQETLTETENELDAHIDAREQMELDLKDMQTRAEELEADILSMQAERDEALRGQNDIEIEFENLKQEAQQEIDDVGAENDGLRADLERLDAELADKTENFAALQAEMRAMSDGVLRLEDDQDAKMRRIQELENEVDSNNREFEELQKHLQETNDKLQRLQVQYEGLQSEVSFVREDQEGDKVRIGELEIALKTAEKNFSDENNHRKEIEHLLDSERASFAAAKDQNQEKVHKMLSKLNKEVQTAKDDARMAHKRAQAEERESAAWKARLQELENNLGEALGNLHGTRASLLKSVENLQREMEATSRELEDTRSKLNDKDRLVKQRDALLESHGLETRQISDLLDKERQSHRSTKHQFETFQKQHQHVSRTVTQQESRMLELETSRAADRKKLTQLENSFKDQLTERNTLLLTLWNRLTVLCGTDWTHNNRLINGRALPTVEAVATMLPGFSKNLFAAVKAIEGLVSDFKTKIKSIERDMTKEYQNLEHTLESKIKKLDRLEIIVKSGGLMSGSNGQTGLSTEARNEIGKLKEANRSLKVELTKFRNIDQRSKSLMPAEHPSPSPSVPTGPRSRVPMPSGENHSERSERTDTLTRHHSTSTVETLDRLSSSSASSNTHPNSTSLARANSASVTGSTTTDEAGEQRWIFRLRELERRLRAEREARLLDRSGARKRLLEVEGREMELRRELEREKVRAAAGFGANSNSGVEAVTPAQE